LKVHLDEAFGTDWLALLAAWDRDSQTRRIFERDASLWTDSGEQQWLGWLDLPEREYLHLEELLDVQQMFAEREFRDVVLLGMGGSSLGPEVQASVLSGARSKQAFGRLTVLDSTDPARIRAVEDSIDFESTMVIASSKSGGTLETRLLRDHFWQLLEQRTASAAEHFMVITDPGSDLARWAAERSVAVQLGDPEVGGRFSVLSRFGLIPAAAIGIDLERWLDGARTMAQKCRGAQAAENPGVALGLLLAAAVRSGRNKLMVVGSESVPGFGAWLEQLIAESTGKQGKMMLAIDGEPLRAPDSYGGDRLFVAVGPLPAGHPDLMSFGREGHPVASITMESSYDLAGEFYRWEIATAVLGSCLQVDPFTQPDVESAKTVTRDLVAGLEKGEPQPQGRLLGQGPGIELRSPLSSGADDPVAEVREVLEAHLATVAEGGYLAILAYVNPSAENVERLENLRARVANRIGHATTLGFGPRYLHSTGQAHKGGVPCGSFLVITDSPPDPVPLAGGGPLSFLLVRDAQAQGDARVLAERGRPVVMAHLSGSTSDGLDRLLSALA
jgi:transaldolase/glucose-6-phosphate isomerase